MRRAALYARVSTDAQQKEATIESQLYELKKQIAAAGDVLVKEYIDDGYSGKFLDRPALEQLRTDLKTDFFDVIYFHAAERIARAVAHQNIFVDEVLKHRKKLIIAGKDYEENPENKFALTVMGAAAEFERAKIIERTTRAAMDITRSRITTPAWERGYAFPFVKNMLPYAKHGSGVASTKRPVRCSERLTCSGAARIPKSDRRSSRWIFRAAFVRGCEAKLFTDDAGHIPPQPTDQDRDINGECQHHRAGNNQRQQHIDNLHPSGRG